MDEKAALKEINKLKKQHSAIIKGADSSIDAVLNGAKELLGDGYYEKWKDLTNRMLVAQLKGDVKTVESLKKDMEKIVAEKEAEEKKDNENG